MLKIEIAPYNVHHILSSDQTQTPEPVARWLVESDEDEAVVVSDGMNMATVIKDGFGWKTTRIACMNPAHGTHSRFKNMLSEKQRKLIEESLESGLKNKQCSECEGGWFDIDSPEAKKQIMLAEQFGIFRGVKIGVKVQENLQDDSASAMLGMFLSKDRQSLDASCPPVRQTGRAFFFQQTDEE